MSEEKKRILTLLQRLYTAIKSTNKNVSSMKEDNMVLLWENSAPGSAFAAQTIKMDLTDYKWVKIETMPYAGRFTQVTTNEFQCPGAGDTFAPTTRSDIGGSGWWHGSRTVVIAATGITFGGGGYRYSNASSAGTGDAYGVPYRIWGIKKSYSVSLVKDVLPAENGGTGVTSLEELKSKLGVISGGGSGGSGGPLTLSDSRLLQTYLGLKNVELYSSDTEWKMADGAKTIPGISNYEKIMVYLWDGYDGIELQRIDNTKFQGTGFATNVSSGSHSSIALILYMDGDVVTIGANSVEHHTQGSSHTKFNDVWVKRIVGLEPTAEYAKQKLGITDTTIENGTVKFKPVDVKNRTLLWTNPDFSAATFAKQTIDVPWQDYDAICVEYAYNPSGSKPYKDSCTVSCPVPGGSSVGHLEYLWLTTAGASNGAERYFTIKDGGIEFDTGWYGANNAAASIHNEFCVPLYIYGIKNKVTVDIPEVDLNGGANAPADLNPDTLIPSGADLNNYTAVGSYKSVNAANSKTLSNTPYTGGGFNLQVISTSLDDIKQVLIANSANTALVYIRSITASGTVNDWVQMGTTVITKVWENASIGSTFAAQTLKIPATADYILILTNRGQVIIVPKNAGQIIYYGCEAYPNQRAFTYTNNSLAVTAGEVLNSGWKTNNDALKPWKIFELKGVL